MDLAILPPHMDSSCGLAIFALNIDLAMLAHVDLAVLASHVAPHVDLTIFALHMDLVISAPHV